MTKVKVRYENKEQIVNGYTCEDCSEDFVAIYLPNYCPECGEEISGTHDLAA